MGRRSKAWTTILGVASALVFASCRFGEAFDGQPPLERVWSEVGSSVSHSPDEARNIRNPDITVDGDDHPVVVYVIDDRLMVSRWTGEEWVSLGSPSDGPVCSPMDHGLRPQITTDASGAPVVMWLGDMSTGMYSGPLGLEVSRWIGEVWENLATPERGFSPLTIRHLGDIVRAEDGSLFVALVTADSGVLVQRFDGETWECVGETGGGVMMRADRNYREAPRIVLDPEGRPLLVWRLSQEIPLPRGSTSRRFLRAVYWSGERWIDLLTNEDSDAIPPSPFPDAVLTAGWWGYPVFVWWSEPGGEKPTALIHSGEEFLPLRADIHISDLISDSDLRFHYGTSPEVAQAPGHRPFIAYRLWNEPFGSIVRVRQWNGEQWAEVGSGSGGRGLAGGKWMGYAFSPDITLDSEGHPLVTFIGEELHVMKAEWTQSP